MGKKLDIEKLRGLGVPENVIADMDPLDGGNIDSNGNVLFLDEERQKSKERPDKPLRKNGHNPIKNALSKKVAGMIAKEAASGSMEGAKKPFQILDKAFQKPVNSPAHQLVMGLMGFNKKGYSGGNVLPLNIDLSEQTQSGIIPMDLAVDAMERADYIAILNQCVCRVSFNCKDYPTDLGCIFINVAGRSVVNMGIAKEATVEEAKEHIRKAREAGLFCNAEFVEGEQMVWGLRNDQMNEFKMFCFCCDCCCVALRALKNGTKEDKKRYQSCGYTATVDHSKCIGCRKCQTRCSVDAITYREDGKCRIDQDMCLGCGFCKDACESEAIRILQTFPMRKNYNEYFIKELRIDDSFTKNK